MLELLKGLRIPKSMCRRKLQLKKSQDGGSNDSSSSIAGGSDAGAAHATPMHSGTYTTHNDQNHIAALLGQYELTNQKLPKRNEKTTRRRRAEERSQTTKFKIKKIIMAAERILAIRLSQNDRGIAINYFNSHYETVNTDRELAMMALLALMSLHFTGEIQPVAPINWGSQIPVINIGPDFGDVDNCLPIDRSFRIGGALNSDPLSLNPNAITNEMQQTDLQAGCIQYIESNRFQIKQNTVAAAPTMRRSTMRCA